MMRGQAKRSITHNKKGKCLLGFHVICIAEKKIQRQIKNKKNLPTLYTLYYLVIAGYKQRMLSQGKTAWHNFSYFSVLVPYRNIKLL